MNRVQYVYPDGGLIFPNPSPYGISWAAVIVFQNDITGKIDTVETAHFGHPKQFDLPTVENNLAETMGILHVLEFLSTVASHAKVDATRFTIRCDNALAIDRARSPGASKMGGVPDSIAQRLSEVTRKFPHVRYELIGGSMRSGDLERGHREDGKSVHRENVRADYLCRLQCFRAALAMGLIEPESKYPRPKIKCDGAGNVPLNFHLEVESIREKARQKASRDGYQLAVYRPADEVYDFPPSYPDFGNETGG